MDLLSEHGDVPKATETPRVMIGDTEYMIFDPGGDRTEAGTSLEEPFIYDEYAQYATEGARGQRVLIIGSGPNTESWRALGCTTLDVSTDGLPDIVADANNLIDVIAPGSQDAIILECVTLDPEGKVGVNLDAFIPQAYAALAEGGKIFISTASSVHEPPRPTKLPKPSALLHLLRSAGFENCAAWHGPLLFHSSEMRKRGDKVLVDSFLAQSAMIYYGERKQQHTV